MKTLDFEMRGGLGVLTLKRPEALNALNQTMLKELTHFFRGEPPARAILITGAGEKAFCAGADLKELEDLEEHEVLAAAERGHEAANAIEESACVTIGAVNGFALGGGFEMALACDFIYASKMAKFGLPEVTLGLIPGYGGTQRLCHACGERMAKELIFSGEIISAEIAKNIGIVNMICEPEHLIEDASKKAEKILNNAFSAVILAKRAVHIAAHTPLDKGSEIERTLFTEAYAAPNSKEGIRAFIDKRRAEFI